MKKSISEKFIKSKNLQESATAALLGIAGTTAGASLLYKYKNRNIKKFDSIGPNGCDRLESNSKKLNCKLYFLKKEYKNKTGPIYDKMEKIQKFMDKNDRTMTQQQRDMYNLQWSKLDEQFYKLGQNYRINKEKLKKQYS